MSLGGNKHGRVFVVVVVLHIDTEISKCLKCCAALFGKTKNNNNKIIVGKRKALLFFSFCAPCVSMYVHVLDVLCF